MRQVAMAGVQRELSERVEPKTGWLPAVRPTADVELEESFVRAAAAWARWRERRRWAGRGS
jgi:hypothetical protein